MEITENYISNIVEFYRDSSRYLKSERESVAASNYTMLRNMSIISFCITCCFIFVTPFIISNWHMSIWYVVLALIFLVTFLYTVFFRKKIEYNSKKIYTSCVIVVFLSIVSFACISIVPNPETSDVYFGLVIMILPALFILPTWVDNTLSIVLCVTYLILVINFKTGFGKEHDIFSTIFALLFSRVISLVFMRMRLQTYKDKMKLLQNSRTDQLTGLYNKITFDELCRNVCEKEEVVNGNAFLMIDIDNFKNINDSYGHREGDRLIRIISNCLQSSFAVGDIIGRVGGDEFAVLLKNVSDDEMIERIVNRFMVSVNKKTNEAFNRAVTASIGCVLLPNRQLPYSKIYEIADEALYFRKRNGKCGFRIVQYEDIDIEN